MSKNFDPCELDYQKRETEVDRAHQHVVWRGTWNGIACFAKFFPVSDHGLAIVEATALRSFFSAGVAVPELLYFDQVTCHTCSDLSSALVSSVARGRCLTEMLGSTNQLEADTVEVLWLTLTKQFAMGNLVETEDYVASECFIRHSSRRCSSSEWSSSQAMFGLKPNFARHSKSARQ